MVQEGTGCMNGLLFRHQACIVMLKAEGKEIYGKSISRKTSPDLMCTYMTLNLGPW